MKEIPLTQGKVALVDDADFERINQFKWFARRTKTNWYAVRSVWKGTPPIIYMHRFIMDVAEQIDHADGNGLNNQRSNLRPATPSQNHANITRLTQNTSGFRGVTRHRKNGKWQAQIKSQKRFLYIGTFDEKEHAALAYDGAAEVFFGEFARLNFPELRGAQ